MSHFAEMLPLLAEYVHQLEREAAVRAEFGDDARAAGRPTSEIVPELEAAFDAAVREARAT